MEKKLQGGAEEAGKRSKRSPVAATYSDRGRDGSESRVKNSRGGQGGTPRVKATSGLCAKRARVSVRRDTIQAAGRQGV
uniref:Uncharacterized protein n=1 Tax=Arundo donax TaxID=35708 RepID=A0A0A9F652_ARUDO